MPFQPLWIAGTDTGIGKTMVSSVITFGLNAVYWKPVQSGIENGLTDTEAVKQATQLPDKHFLSERWLLSEPYSPHLAARLDGVHIDLSDFSLPVDEKVDSAYLIIEGAGGLYVPLNENDLLIDLMHQMYCPVILVCKSGLGTINHSLLSIQALKMRQVPILGCVFNGETNFENEKAVTNFSGVPILGRIPRVEGVVDQAALFSIWEDSGLATSIPERLRDL